ncbi:sarcosine oxidase subunit alpha family protein [Mesorhizobium sp. VK25A]|uniref:Sarcosine oxidase subunit alpha family protein n=1 Tax=Mesorhizobium vachelliae TaxID=3072309 RepID=A0ABU5AF59_9HYPH|nr:MULTISPECIES: sarcosine oxidase subunit alpha family protein [unclassified Mesorhizobium]MDX8535912.1 sarcosine oxidase subunit alpha family protein [Mesorhizobium sp. VK25D]MDX8548662.1 sarcosine oxidase subunit alpha family protein [Mesorhizobium sp. VK25A]
MKRLANGGRIDRSHKVTFSFDGKRLSGFRGDTLASALVANNISLVGRSFKYHRPRGIMSAGPEEPNALVTLGVADRREPNIPATTVELVDGLVSESQNRWPSLGFDIQSINSWFSPFLAAGFYYKTFMGPTRGSWMFYEHYIRKAAGLGRASDLPDPDRYEVRHLFADVVIIGSGPAGLSAALAAAQAGARVTLVEQDFLLGGSLLSEPTKGAAQIWLDEISTRLGSMPNVTILRRNIAFGVYDGNVIGMVEEHGHQKADPSPDVPRQTLSLLRAKAIVYATGAIERPLIFASNDRPGVMLASAVRTYLNRYSVLTGTNVLIATDNDSAYSTAWDLIAAGAKVSIIDSRAAVSRDVLQRARKSGVDVRFESWVTKAVGGKHVIGALIAGPNGKQKHGCDLIAVSGGWSPTVHLTSHRGVKPVYREDIDAFVPGRLSESEFVVGALAGDFASSQVAERGFQIGLEAAEFCGLKKPARHPPLLDLREDISKNEGTIPRTAKASIAKGKAFVDFQMDVTASDIALAHREGFVSIEHLKRYTTLGMGTDQGKTSNFHGLSAMAGLRSSSVVEVGTTTFRPPYTPLAMGALAGRRIGHHYKPIRRTPMHDWHVANSGRMLETGLWMRPWFYSTAGRDVETAYVKEMRIVRESAGLMDISTLGKIELQGPGAATLLDRVYVNGFASLQIGRARYGVMLRDDGIVFDDGTTTRIDEQRFFMTTSTAKAGDVMSRLEFLLETAWKDLDVSLTSVSDEWAAMSIAGPKSREILSAAFEDLDFSNDNLPHMGSLEGTFGGKPLRVLRLSFSGERAYEVYVGSTQGEELWKHLLEVGDRFGLRPYGLEALGALRIEKGHIAGPEIDGRTALDDLRLRRMAGKRQGFVGDVLSRREALNDPKRAHLVGLQSVDTGKRLRGGALLFRPGDKLEGHGLGRVTSVTYSPTLNSWVGLALLARDASIEGAEVLATYPMNNETVRARIVSPVFLDSSGERFRG